MGGLLSKKADGAGNNKFNTVLHLGVTSVLTAAAVGSLGPQGNQALLGALAFLR